jgi:hypothetical protein
MDKAPLKVATYTGFAGLLMSIALIVVSVLRHGAGRGENIEWLLSYLLLIGFPITVAAGYLRPIINWLNAPLLVTVTMVLAVIVDWALVGFLIGVAVRAFQRIARQKTVHPPTEGGRV